jgi:hypothetical protein
VQLAGIPIIIMRILILSMCTVNDYSKIKAIKEAVLIKLDHWFPETPNVNLHQFLDPETKNLIPREEATTLLEDAIKKECP